MGNGLFDLGSDDGLQFFLGGGVCLARIRHQITVDGDSIYRTRESKIAWQCLAGLRFPVSDKVDLGLKYRYFNVPDYIATNSVDGLR